MLHNINLLFFYYISSDLCILYDYNSSYILLSIHMLFIFIFTIAFCIYRTILKSMRHYLLSYLCTEVP